MKKLVAADEACKNEILVKISSALQLTKELFNLQRSV